MGNPSRCRTRKRTFGLPRSLGCITLFAAAAATEAVVTKLSEMANTPSIQDNIVSVIASQDEDRHTHPFTAFNMVVGQSLGGVDASAIKRWQARRQRSQRLAVVAGLVAVVCLAVAFVVLQCSRKVLAPMLFGSMGKRILSNSGFEEQWIDVCIGEEEEEDEEDATIGGAEEGENSMEETGETKALQTLNDLKSFMILGLQIVPYVPFDKRDILIVLLLTISIQELVLYGIYSTPQVELKRQQTMDFILQDGQRALEQVYANCEISAAGIYANKLLGLLEQLRSPRLESIPEELVVEATISMCRISSCMEALQQLRPWVESSIPIPQEIVKRTVRILVYTRLAGKGRLKADTTAYTWVRKVQAGLDFYGIFEKNYEPKFPLYRLPLGEEMRERRRRYKKLARLLTSSVEFALSHQPLERHVQERRQQVKQQEHQGLQPVHQQHHSIIHLSEGTAAPCCAIEPIKEQAIWRTDVGVMASHPPFPSPPAHHQTPLPARVSSLLTYAVPTLSQTFLKDSHQTTPTTHLERQYRAPHCSDPYWCEMQQEKGKQQSSLYSFKSESVVREEAPVMTRSEPMDREAEGLMPRITPGVRDARLLVPPPPGFEHFRRPAGPSTTLRSRFPLPQLPSTLTKTQSGCSETVFAVSSSVPNSFMPLLNVFRGPHRLPPPPLNSARPPLWSEGPSFRFPRPTFQLPTSEIPQRQQISSSHRFSAARLQIPASRFEAPATFWPPADRSTQGSVYLQTSVDSTNLNPLLPLISEAFPTEGTHRREEAEQRSRLEEGQPVAPPSRLRALFHSSEVSSDTSSSMSGFAGERASSFFAVAPRAQASAAWSLWKNAEHDTRQ